MYKQLHSFLIREYIKNIDGIIHLSKRFDLDDDTINELTERLKVTISKSMLDIYKNRMVMVIVNPHGGSTNALRVFYDLNNHCVDLGNDCQAAV